MLKSLGLCLCLVMCGGCIGSNVQDQLMLAAVRALTKALDNVDESSAVCLELPEMSDDDYVYILCRASNQGAANGDD